MLGKDSWLILKIKRKDHNYSLLELSGESGKSASASTVSEICDNKRQNSTGASA